MKYGMILLTLSLIVRKDKMKKKFISILVLMCMLVALTPDTAAAASNRYTDIPDGNWSVSAVNAAAEYELMQGMGDGTFGFGRTITRAEFVTALDRMFGWDVITPATSSFSDVSKNQWFYSYIETALKHDVVDKNLKFDPADPITREEMAIMLVRALGYKTLAQSASSFGQPFKDVSANAGYITIASDIGMTKGTSATAFSPKLTAKREEAAAMLVRVYEKDKSKTNWIHGFYAFSSYSQKDLTKDMNAVSVGWSRMSFDPAKGPYLNTTSTDSNEWNIPQSYETITSYFDENSVKTNLNVYMSTSTTVTAANGSSSNICQAILLDSAKRTQAVNAIVQELTVDYQTIGSNPYSGVTIDFEGMKGSALKSGFNSFLTELAAALKPLGKTLNVTVEPATADGIYYDAYDYRSIGQLADKVILMAYDYNATTMPQNLLGSASYRNTAVTPFPSVYYSLKAITDSSTGVEDTSKIVLGISFDSVAWKLQNAKLASTSSLSPSIATIYSRLKAGALMGYSEVYRDPYLTYTTEDGTDIFLWYEDSRSVNDKIQLAHLFGINGVSFWRIGNIPDYADAGLYYDVLESFK